MDLANAHYTSPKSTVEGHGSQTYIIMNLCILKKKTNIKKNKKIYCLEGKQFLIIKF